MKLLAVDDDASIRELLPMILKRVGYEDVVIAASASEAIDILTAADDRFDCLLLDIQMPKKNGIELCAEVREMRGYDAVPIIMLTAMHEREFIEQAFEAGADDYLTKPFSISEVGLRTKQAMIRKMSGDLPGPALSEPKPDSADFEDPTILQGVKGVLQPLAFENYVRQLSRSGLQVTYFHATCISNAGKLCRSLSEDDFRYALQHAADAILEVLSNYNGLTAYLGKGVFLASTTEISTRAAKDIEAEIQDLLDERTIVSENDLPIDMDVAVGANVLPMPRGGIDFDDLKFRAVARAQTRIKEISDTARPIQTRRIGY